MKNLHYNYKTKSVYKLKNFKLTKIKTNPNPLMKNPLMTGHLAVTHKVKILTPKTTKCGKIMKLKSPSKYLPTLQQKYINDTIVWSLSPV